MKLGIVINTNDPEKAWNALRLGNTALEAGHDVSVFLMGSGVEIENIKNETYDVGGTLSTFLNSNGTLLACGTCLKARQQEGGVCPISTMADLLEMIADSDKVVTFG
ncbi:MAG: DsrE family protein [Dehalococcoidales bacterium]|nr:DsrE family protein [Dehalococcoidales bacterium]